MMVSANGSIDYCAHRLRFILAAVFLVPLTLGIGALAYDGVALGDTEVRSAWILVVLAPIYLWFDFIIVAKLISPPRLSISLSGIRWANPALLEWNTDYDWQDINGPEQTSGGGGVPLLQVVVKATGRKLKLPPSHFGATYDEMAAVISAARSGKLIAPEQWRSEHPQHPLKHWLVEWGLPIVGGLVIALTLHGWRL